MLSNRDAEYQDPSHAGSLSHVLTLWIAVLAAGSEAIPYRLDFLIGCPGEARAHRVARFLERRLSCQVTDVRPSGDAGREQWTVGGSTSLEVQSLRALERLATWLRRAAASHQVRVQQLSLVAQAA